MADPPLISAALTAMATHLAMAGEPAAPAARAAERALLGMAGAPRGRAWSEAVRVLVVTEHYDVAGRELERALADGGVAEVADALALRADLRLRVGDLPRALADARRLHALAAVSGHPRARGCAAARLAEALLEIGAIDEAAGLFEESPLAASAAALPAAYAAECVLLARGRLRLAQGRVDDAVEDLRECGRRALAAGTSSPAVVPWRSLLAGALRVRGEVGEARRLAADELERARRCGAPRALGIALCGAGDDIELLQEAVAVLEGSAARLVRARALARLGAALRHAGHRLEARAPLRRALDLAHRSGAIPLEEHALTELRAAGARPRRRLASGAGALTPRERDVAELAAAGHMNREIADALYVTLDTVEYHLRHCYRKLGIISRNGLTTALTSA